MSRFKGFGSWKSIAHSPGWGPWLRLWCLFQFISIWALGKRQEQVHSRIGGSVEMRCEMLYLQTAKAKMKSKITRNCASTPHWQGTEVHALDWDFWVEVQWARRDTRNMCLSHNVACSDPRLPSFDFVVSSDASERCGVAGALLVVGIFGVCGELKSGRKN